VILEKDAVPASRERKEIRQPMDRRAGQEQRDRRRVEDGSLLGKQERVTAEFGADPEGAFAGPESPLRRLPDRQVLVTQIELKERPPA
jgi:hypothetical protein